MQKILKTESFVRNAEEALLLVKKFKEEGKYDIFRGQKECWPLISSIVRLNKKKRQLSETKLNRFANWILKNDDLDLKGNKDKILSIAQHYGLSTSLIDFTYSPEVAIYFATIKKSKEKGCIYCASKEDLQISIDNFKKSFNKIDLRIIELEVENLWRLQSQQGLFFNAPFAGIPFWEDFFPFHKIIFSHNSTFKPVITNEIIYPIRKSKLEIKLDQYFREEEVHEGLNFAESKGFEITLTPWESNNYIFKANQKPVLVPWEKTQNIKWKSQNSELYINTVGKVSVEIKIEEAVNNPNDVKSVFKKKLLLALQENESIKKKAVIFNVSFNNDKIFWLKEMTASLDLFWDGVRQFPFSNEEICEGFGNLAAILFASQLKKKKDYISHVFGDTYAFEFLIKNAGHSRVTLPKKPFIEALNASILNHVDKSLYPKITKPFDVIYHIHDIEILFDFNSFKDLLVKYIIPCQIIANMDTTGYYSSKNDAHCLVVFSPYEIIKIRSATASLSYNQRFRHKDKIVALHPDLTDQELILLMADSLKKIEIGLRPITITFSGFEQDDRVIYKIPEAVKFCKKLLNLGFISILEVATSVREMPDTFDPYVLGAFEIWLIANNKMKKEIHDVRVLMEDFLIQLPEYNNKCDSNVKDILNIDQKIIEDIKTKGLFGTKLSKYNRF